MMEAVRTSETSADNYFTRQYIPETILNVILAAARTCNLTTVIFFQNHKNHKLSSKTFPGPEANQIRIHNTLVMPSVLYGRETSTLKLCLHEASGRQVRRSDCLLQVTCHVHTSTCLKLEASCQAGWRAGQENRNQLYFVIHLPSPTTSIFHGQVTCTPPAPFKHPLASVGNKLLFRACLSFPGVLSLFVCFIF
jgi:hypothetical protein